MSFFPSADPDDEQQTPYTDSRPFFQAPTPPYSAHLQNLPLDWNCDYDTTTRGLPVAQPVAWPPATQQPNGLGLQHMTENYMPFCSGPADLSHSATTSFTWPADFTPTHTPSVSAHAFRKVPGDNSFIPPSTIHPSQLWEPFPPAITPTAASAPSPGRSEYSTDDFLSTTPSPFIHSDGYLRTAASPMIKVESEPFPAGSPMFEGVPPVDASPAVSSRSLVAQPEHRLRQQDDSTVDYTSDINDLKPSLRPGYRRAYSAADTEDPEFLGRHKRSLTRPENASCSCDLCGKLFQRCYNLKAHMQTHEPTRNTPNKCKHPGCGKRFVRRTDLTRHTQSVHLKSRPFACSRCYNTFARKDTLQRHVEDGCPLRPEVRKRLVRPSRSRAGSFIKQESSHSRTPEPHAMLSEADIRRLQQS